MLVAGGVTKEGILCRCDSGAQGSSQPAPLGVVVDPQPGKLAGKVIRLCARIVAAAVVYQEDFVIALQAVQKGEPGLDHVLNVDAFIVGDQNEAKGGGSNRRPLAGWKH